MRMRRRKRRGEDDEYCCWSVCLWMLVGCSGYVYCLQLEKTGDWLDLLVAGTRGRSIKEGKVKKETWRRKIEVKPHVSPVLIKVCPLDSMTG